MIEVRNPRRNRGASHPDLEYYADVTLHIPGRDIGQETCCLAPTIRNVLGTLAWDHPGENGANDYAVLVGVCGQPGCCGVDFGVSVRGEAVEISWPDPSELLATEIGFRKEHPHEVFFPNEAHVGRVVTRVSRDEYVGDVLRLAAVFLRTRVRLGAPDDKTQKLFEWCGGEHPDLFRAVQSKADRSDLLRFDGNESK